MKPKAPKKPGQAGKLAEQRSLIARACGTLAGLEQKLAQASNTLIDCQSRCDRMGELYKDAVKPNDLKWLLAWGKECDGWLHVLGLIRTKVSVLEKSITDCQL